MDILPIILNDAPVEDSDESRPGVLLDFDAKGNVVGFEVLDASKPVGHPTSLEYAIER